MIQHCITGTREFRKCVSRFPRTFSRQKSLQASIERGIRDTERPKYQSRPSQGRAQARETDDDSSRYTRQTSRLPIKRGEQSLDIAQTYPDGLPYTTAASEFLYGQSEVAAAILSCRRKLYNLYLHTRSQRNSRTGELIKKAATTKLPIYDVDDRGLKLLDKASGGRPHNGFILEASPLPRPPITSLMESSIIGSSFKLSLDKQSKEDALVNGIQRNYTYKSAGWRHPLVLYVDSVLDEGNLGAIARSAYFLGVDALITSTRSCAPWSNVTLKAAAGAAEALPIFTVNEPLTFLSQSARNGWRIYASDAVPPGEDQPVSVASSPPTDTPTSSNLSSNLVLTYAKSTNRMQPDHCPVESHPTILMMGGEGYGLRPSLLNQAHYKVGIRAGRETNVVGVDSLNVSVAASILCYEFLQKPKPSQKPGGWLF